ncbi:MAG: T9SS type A sorting domain-containing protein [Flavobacteriales bacterium]
MRTNFFRTLLAGTALIGGIAASAQGLEGIIVEEYHTVTAADADAYNNDFGGGSYPLVAGMKVYRVYVDMAPNYRFLNVFASPETTPGSGVSPNPVTFQTTTSFWNDDNFGGEVPVQTRRMDEGTLFDSYITVGTTGIAGGTAGCGTNTAQVGVLRSADTDGDNTTCGNYPDFTGNDGNIPGTLPSLTYNLGGAMNLDAINLDANTFTFIDDAWAILPASTGVDGAGTNRVLIGQFTTNGVFSFQINVAISDPNQNIETYVHTNAGDGEQVSPFLTYPQSCVEPVITGITSNGPICSDADLLLNVTATGDAPLSYSWSGTGTFSPDASSASVSVSGAASGSYSVTVSNACGTVTESTNVVVDQTSSNTTTESACDSYTWAVNGTTYTQSGTYTVVNGCATEILVLTITESTSNTTTESACDSYTGAVNGQTYTQSGTYTEVNGCATEILVLTITESTSNTTTESACDSYTWAVNGQTYTQSGTYTEVNGCATEILVLTILESGTNTTTESACDSYTWAVNGTTYTQSGTYTSVNGCATEILVLTIIESGTNTTTESVCDSYTWSVNGTTYTQSGTYTEVTGCSTEILVLTITESTSNTTTESACGSYTWAVNGTTYTQSGTYTEVNGCATEILVLTVSVPGTACDDGNANTINDQLDANCVCVGTPATTDCLGVIGGTALPGTPCDDGLATTGNDTWSNDCQCVGQVIDCEGVAGGTALPGTPCNDNNAGTINDTWSVDCQCVGVPTGCTENIVLNITLDAFGSQTTWELQLAGTGTIVEQGGPYMDGMPGAVVTEELCVPAACYRLVVNDAAGDGIVAGGYQLLVSGSNARVIDNRNNFDNGAVSAISGGQGFCLPIGTDNLLSSSCDKLDWVSGQYVVASANPAVSAEWIVGGSNAVQDNNSGYEFWIFDPNGSYSFRRFRSHNVSDGFGPASATRACHMKINNWNVVNQIPANVLMNVRVRSRVNGVNSEFGPACQFTIDPVRAACPLTQLMNIAGNQFFSCGVTRTWGAGNYVYARPVSGANRYQFRFSQPGEGVIAVRTTTNYILQLNWPTNPLQAGETYDVEVRVSKNGGATWCTNDAVWGPVCQVTIAGSAMSSLNAMSFDLQDELQAAELRMFPNPTRGDVLNFSLSAVDAGEERVSFDIYDLSGKRVSSRQLPVNAGAVNTVIELNSELSAGMYMVNITAGARLYTERLMVQP